MAEASSAAGAARAAAVGAAPPAPAVVAVDVGGTTVKGAVIDAAGAVVARRVVPTTSPGVDAAASLEGLVADLLATAADAGRTACGIGVASPGLVDVRAGVVEYASNLGWRDHPVVTRLQDRFALPARLEHDARAGLLAERSARRDTTSGALPADLAFVPIGTGISAALVSGGNVLPGATGAAGEFGHAVVVPGGEPCACGLRGCLESYASAAAVGRRYVARGGPLGSTSRDVVARLASDPAARDVWQEAVEALARALAGLVALLDPRLVVVGGGLALAGTALSVPLAAALEGALPWRRTPQLDLSRVGPSAGLIGAALLALEAADLPAPVPAGFHLRVREERLRPPL